MWYLCNSYACLLSPRTINSGQKRAVDGTLNSIKFSKLVNSEHSLSPEEVEWIWILDRIPSQNICIFDVFRPTGPILPLLDGFDPSLTYDEPNWPWKIFDLNSWGNSESKYILDIFRLIRPFRPQFDDLTQVWPILTFKLNQVAPPRD